jgi:hypothetical protein
LVSGSFGLPVKLACILDANRDLKELLDAYEKDPNCFYLYTGRVSLSALDKRMANNCMVVALTIVLLLTSALRELYLLSSEKPKGLNAAQ